MMGTESHSLNIHCDVILVRDMQKQGQIGNLTDYRHYFVIPVHLPVPLPVSVM